MVKGLLGASSITGPTAPLWVGAAEMTSAYDAAQCSYYDTCDLTSKLTAAALPLTYKCDDGHTFLAQSRPTRRSPRPARACRDRTPTSTALSGTAARSPTTATPTSRSSSSRAPGSTGPTQAGSSATAPTTAANTWRYSPTPTTRPASSPTKSVGDGFPADIWNLNHEYTHYLDGRYDTYGDFSAGQTVPDIWWIEGFAEYVSYSYRGVPDTEALSDAGKHTYALSTLWQSTWTPTPT